MLFDFVQVIAVAWLCPYAVQPGYIPDVTPADVTAMIARVPAPGKDSPGGYERGRDATVIAAGIAQAVNEETETVLDNARQDAALLAVFSAWESAERSCANGDGGAALGAFQLHGARAAVACDPHLAAVEWLRRAREAMGVCVEHPYEERLALLASGSCARARELSRRRVKVAEAIATPTDSVE